MSQTTIPVAYRSALNLYETQVAIGNLRHIFQDKLSAALNLKRVSAPLFVDPLTGLNDDLSGVERAVAFEIKETGQEAQVVHSLAKWKRMALYQYGFAPGEGLYTDMNAIRRDEELTNLHSVYVDQWDWEKVIPEGQRTMQYLIQTVQYIADAIFETAETIRGQYPALLPAVTNKIKFITSQELEDMYPDKSGKEREDLIVKTHKAVFITGIGGALRSGKPHDSRAPDYDDWTLNGDLLYWNENLQRAMELSSMGIRVDAQALDRQLSIAGCDHRRKLEFHQMLLAEKLPLTIGGGIGQSRLCMLMLNKAHIGEVQTSLWDDKTKQLCQAAGITLL